MDEIQFFMLKENKIILKNVTSVLFKKTKTRVGQM